MVDFGDDPDCSSPDDNSEGAAGSGGFCSGDSDGDGDTCESFLGEDATNCPADCYGSPITQCQNATDTNGDGIADTGDDDGDGLVDHAGAGWVNGPDPDCSSAFDDSEFPGGSPQCSDGIDNDGDAFLPGGGTDYPGDSSCTSPSDNSEITYVVLLCPDTGSVGDSNGPSNPNCERFSASDPDLSDNTGPSVVGTNNAEKFVGNLQFTANLIVRLCLEPNFVNCVQMSGSVDDLSTIPGLNNNDVESIEVIQP